MEQRIIDAANKYAGYAIKLKDFDEQHILSESVPEKAGLALLKLYFALHLEAGLSKCEELLDEDSDEETINAVADAAQAIGSAADDAFSDVWLQASRDRDFAEKIEETAGDSSADGPCALLIKLYKCEGIIREAYRSASNFPLLGGIYGDSDTQPDFGVVTNQEDYIMKRTGIDIYRLLETKQNLIDDIERLVGGPERIERLCAGGNISESAYE